MKDLDSVFKAYAFSDKSTSVKFLPVDRINTVIAVAPNPGIFPQVKEWIEKLDIPVKITAGAINNYVYRLKYGRAETVAMAIMALYTGNVSALMSLASMSSMGGGGMGYGGTGGGMGYGGMGGGGYGGGYGAMGGGYGGGYGGGTARWAADTARWAAIRRRDHVHGLNRGEFQRSVEFPMAAASANPTAAGPTPTSPEATWEIIREVRPIPNSARHSQSFR